MTKILTNSNALADLHGLPRPETAQAVIDNLMVLVNRAVLLQMRESEGNSTGSYAEFDNQYATIYNAIEAHAQELAKPAPRLTWTDRSGVHHSMSHKGALELLERFWDEWPGGWSEVEAEQQARQRTAQELPEFNWSRKSCPCGDYMSSDCIKAGCLWENNPTLVPQQLRKPRK